MENFFVYDGVRSPEFGVWIADGNKFSAPKRDVEEITIPGRNGTLTIDQGRFENCVLTYHAYTKGDVLTNVDALKSHLMSSAQYRRLEDSFYPDIYRMAKYFDAFDVSNSDRQGAAFEIRFNCKPQRWLKSGEYAQQITPSTVLKNPTLYPALPLIRVYGTSGTLYVGNTIVQLKTIDGYVDLDSETQNAYKGTVNCNPNIYAPDFPQLIGETGIRWEGSIDKVEITPRWWTI